MIRKGEHYSAAWPAVYDSHRWIAPVAIGVLGAAFVCAATLTSEKTGTVIVGGVVCLGLLPVIGFFRHAVEEFSLFALAITLSVSLKFHPVFRADHIGGSIGLRISITELLLSVLVVTILLRKRKEDTIRIEADTAILISFAVYWCLGALSAVAGIDKQLGAFQLIACLQSVAVFVFLGSYLTNRRSLTIFLLGFLLALCFQSALTIVQSRKPDLKILHSLGAPEEGNVEVDNGNIDLPDVDLGVTFVEGNAQQRPAGLLIHPNVLASYLILGVTTALGTFLVATSPWMISLSFSALLISAIALYDSLSRSGWAGTVFAIVLAAAIGGKSLRLLPKTKKVVLLVLTLALCSGLVLKADHIYSRIMDTADEAITFRGDLAKIALSMMQAHPILGVGLNSFTEATDDYDPSGNQRLKKFPVHNLYLLEGSETGVPGGLAFLAMVVIVIVQMMRATRSAPANLQWLPLLITCGIAGFWFAQISDFVYRIPILTTILWAQIALGFAAARVAKSEGEV